MRRKRHVFVPTILYTSWIPASSSNRKKRRCNMSDTFCGDSSAERTVKLQTSEKKIVAQSCCSGSTSRPSRKASAMCRGNTFSKRSKFLSLAFLRLTRPLGSTSESSNRRIRMAASSMDGLSSGLMRRQSLNKAATPVGMDNGTDGRKKLAGSVLNSLLGGASSGTRSDRSGIASIPIEQQNCSWRAYSSCRRIPKAYTSDAVVTSFLESRISGADQSDTLLF